MTWKAATLTHSWLAGLFPCARCFLKGKQLYLVYFLNYGLSRNPAFCRSHIEHQGRPFHYVHTYLLAMEHDLRIFDSHHGILASLASLIAVHQADSGVHQAHQELSIKLTKNDIAPDYPGVEGNELRQMKPVLRLCFLNPFNGSTAKQFSTSVCLMLCWKPNSVHNHCMYQAHAVPTVLVC